MLQKFIDLSLTAAVVWGPRGCLALGGQEHPAVSDGCVILCGDVRGCIPTVFLEYLMK